MPAMSVTRHRQLVQLSGRCSKAARSVHRMADSARAQGLLCLHDNLIAERARLERIVGRITQTRAADEEGRPTTSRGWRMDGIMRAEARRTDCPLRVAVRYNDRENADLLAQWEWGADLEEIAEWHQRTSNGIHSQLRRLGASGLEEPCALQP